MADSSPKAGVIDPRLLMGSAPKAHDQELARLRRITESNGWAKEAARILSSGHFGWSEAAFSSCWIELGHRMREQIDDDQALAKILRRAFPPYTGEPIVLYRGENLDLYRAGRIGFAWTPKIDTATVFAEVQNAGGSGGALLRARLGGAIIAGPCGHTRWLGEDQYTVDPGLLEGVEVVAQYPPFT